MSNRSLIWELASKVTPVVTETENTASPVTDASHIAQVQADQTGLFDNNDSTITLLDMFIASVETWRVLTSLQVDLQKRVDKGRTYCKAHQKDIAATKLLGSLELELGALELRIGKEARIQADLEARICDVPNEYICPRCYRVCSRFCQCQMEVAS
jgi:hypothetical protein